MKKYFIMAIAAAAITSCSQDEVMEIAQKQAISFKDAFVENTTRAIDATYSNTTKPESFLVYGNTTGDETGATTVPIFKGVEVSKEITSNASSGNYGYSASYTQYWIPGNTYNFAAVVDADEVTMNVVGMPTIIKYDATNQKDLLYATVNKITKPENGEVGFTFNHMLSKAMFTIKNTMTSNTEDYMYTYRVTNICINNAVLSSEFVVGNNSWGEATSYYTAESPLSFGDVTENTTTENGTTALLIGAVGKADEATSHHQRVLLPGTYTYNEETKTGGLNITCQIETLLNGQVIDVQNYNKSISQTFVAGYAYNFVISLALEEPIKFTVTKVNDWNPATGGTDVNIK